MGPVILPREPCSLDRLVRRPYRHDKRVLPHHVRLQWSGPTVPEVSQSQGGLCPSRQNGDSWSPRSQETRFEEEEGSVEGNSISVRRVEKVEPFLWRPPTHLRITHIHGLLLKCRESGVGVVPGSSVTGEVGEPNQGSDPTGCSPPLSTPPPHQSGHKVRVERYLG